MVGRKRRVGKEGREREEEEGREGEGRKWKGREKVLGESERLSGALEFTFIS